MSQQDIKSDMTSRRTVFPQRQVIHLWANACAKDLRGGNVSTVTASRMGEDQPGAVLRSYAASIGNRLPATVRTPGGERVFLISPGFRSSTTSKHCAWAMAAVPLVSRFDCPADWNGEAATLPQRPPLVSAGLRAFVFTVPRVEPWNGADHAENYAALFSKAVDDLNGLKKALKHGNPARIAEAFAVADYYRRTFTPEAAPLAIPADAPATLSAFRKRREAAAAREAEATASLAHARAAWLERRTRTAEAIRAAYAAAVAGQSSAATLAEKITAWEAGAPWPAEAGQAEGEAAEALRRIVRALLAGKDQEVYAWEGTPDSVKYSLPMGTDYRGAWPEGKGNRRDYGSDRVFWDLCGINPYGGNGVWPRRGATAEAGRDLVRMTADGGEVVTSGGARVPASIARRLWARFGALMSEAATAEAAPAFPGDGAPIPFGPFNWTGWEAATPEARASGGGAWALRVGCHRICAADLCRMAARHAWEGGAK